MFAILNWLADTAEGFAECCEAWARVFEAAGL